MTDEERQARIGELLRLCIEIKLECMRMEL